jgi:ribosomal protein L39E
MITRPEGSGVTLIAVIGSGVMYIGSLPTRRKGMSKKTLPKKKRLAAALKRADPVPAWISLRTGGEVRASRRARNWRRSANIKP